MTENDKRILQMSKEIGEVLDKNNCIALEARIIAITMLCTIAATSDNPVVTAASLLRDLEASLTHDIIGSGEINPHIEVLKNFKPETEN